MAADGMMRAMVLDRPRMPMHLAHLPISHPGPHEILLRVTACGVCRTDLHIADGELPSHRQSLVLGHEAVHRENLCDDARFTGYDRDGGYAEYMLADARYAFHLPARYDDMHAAPLLCAWLS